jgi:flagellin
MLLKIQGGIIMIVQHNMSALNTNRTLGITNKALASSSEKLSSGYRINRAADDAAGLSISEKMRGQIRGLNQASTNAQDGESLIQTAEGALTEIHSVLQRMRELTVQASNDTNVTADRQAIAQEVRALTSEITRIATQTQFNTMTLLSGKFTGKSLQVGANSGQVITFSIGKMTAGALGVSSTVIAKGISTGTKGSVISKLISIVNTAITTVSTERSKLGALQNRLDHTIANADNMAENLQSSESKIRDVDIAKEMVSYSSKSILQQAGQSMLAQANQSTRGVLSLLG